MKKFIVIYHAPLDALQQSMGATPEEAQKGMEEWMVWAEKCGDKLVDMGKPLANGVKLDPEGGSEQSSRQVCGYSILQAESLEEASGLLKDHPHLGWGAGCEIEVHETLAIPGT